MRRFIAIAGISALSLGLAAVPAGAGVQARFHSTPQSGPPGTVIHAGIDLELDNDNCSIPGETVTVELWGPDETKVAEADTQVNDDENFTWAVDLTVPADAASGDYELLASCTDGESFARYRNNSFTVTDAPATTTTTSTTVAAQAATTTTTTTVPVAVTPQAPPASPVVAAPALAG